MPNTQQRKVIVSVLKESGRPLARKEILALGRQKLPSLGAATVNRAIRKMTEHFEIIGIQYPGQPLRYELPAAGEHPHFICRKCDQVFDLPVPMQLPPINAPEGFAITGGEIFYSGTCPDCSNPQNI